MSEIIWKDIPGYENLYEVSDTGIVRSKLRKVIYKDSTIAIHKSKVLKPYPNKNYKYDKITGLRVTLSKNDIQVRFFIHQLVMFAFMGPCPEGNEVAHNDSDIYNNNLSNLRYTTHSENEMDKIVNGTMRYGKVHHNHKNRYKVLDPEGSGHTFESPQLFFRERMPEMEARRFAKRLCDSSRLKKNKRRYKGWFLKEVMCYA